MLRIIIYLSKYIEKVKILQDSFESRFHDFTKEEDSMLAFINPLSEQNVMQMPSNIQMELIDLKTNSFLKMKFDVFLQIKILLI